MVAILRQKRAPGHPVLRAIPLPAFQDNYIWLLAGAQGDCIVVDPGEAGPVLAANLHAAMTGQPLQQYQPQRRSLASLRPSSIVAGAIWRPFG